MLTSAEEREQLVVMQAVSVLVPPLMRTECDDWIQWSNLGMLRFLVAEHPSSGTELSFLGAPLRRRYATATPLLRHCYATATPLLRRRSVAAPPPLRCRSRRSPPSPRRYTWSWHGRDMAAVTSP